ncbi:tyrosine-type recombinase/integrase [Streptomyces sp. NPDC006270]|uniref:tyrosine-type recombinase/integrase n=1 Tax=Streptomyces sp. NPDC006270 TaxID=3364741 RepID=UPI0036941873
MPWAVQAVEDYVINARPRYAAAVEQSALWLTARGGHFQPREIKDRFAAYRDALSLDKALVLHSLRHSHVTHQIEDGADAVFVQRAGRSPLCLHDRAVHRGERGLHEHDDAQGLGRRLAGWTVGRRW